MGFHTSPDMSMGDPMNVVGCGVDGLGPWGVFKVVASSAASLLVTILLEVVVPLVRFIQVLKVRVVSVERLVEGYWDAVFRSSTRILSL